jgi:hypothetical protein
LQQRHHGFCHFFVTGHVDSATPRVLYHLRHLSIEQSSIPRSALFGAPWEVEASGRNADLS